MHTRPTRRSGQLRCLTLTVATLLLAGACDGDDPAAEPTIPASLDASTGTSSGTSSETGALTVEFVPAAGSNLVNSLILLPILLTAWAAAQTRTGR